MDVLGKDGVGYVWCEKGKLVKAFFHVAYKLFCTVSMLIYIDVSALWFKFPRTLMNIYIIGSNAISLGCYK